MTPLLPTPRRLLTLDALFARQRAVRVEPVLVEDTRMPDEPELRALQELACTQVGRLAAEVALEEGGRRAYAPRGESEVMESQRRR